VHGDTVTKLCDDPAGIAAIKHSRCRVVTAGMDRMTFVEPVRIGQPLMFAERDEIRHGREAEGSSRPGPD
jgi:acyl-CoA hydrolase